MIKYYADVDHQRLKVENANLIAPVFDFGATLPTDPVDKQFFFDTSDEQLKCYSKAKNEWLSVGGNKLTFKDTKTFENLTLEKNTVLNVTAKSPYKLSFIIPDGNAGEHNEYYVLVTPSIDVTMEITGSNVVIEDKELKFLHDYCIKIDQYNGVNYVSKVCKRNEALDKRLYFYFKKVNPNEPLNANVQVVINDKSSDSAYSVYSSFVDTSGIYTSTEKQSTSFGITETFNAKMPSGWLAVEGTGDDNLHFNVASSFGITGTVTKTDSVSFSVPNQANLAGVELRGNIQALITGGDKTKIPNYAANKITYAKLFTGSPSIVGFDEDVFSELEDTMISQGATPSAFVTGIFQDCKDFCHMPTFMPKVTNISNGTFLHSFSGTALTEVPDNTFSSVISAGLLSFGYTFSNCASLFNVGKNVFSNVETCTGEMTFIRVFQNDFALTRLPSGMWCKVKTLCKSAFSSALLRCKSLVGLPKGMFSNLETPSATVDYTHAFWAFAEHCWSLKKPVFPFIDNIVNNANVTSTGICLDMYKDCPMFTLRQTAGNYGELIVMTLTSELATEALWKDQFSGMFDDLDSSNVVAGQYILDEKTRFLTSSDINTSSFATKDSLNDYQLKADMGSYLKKYSIIDSTVIPIVPSSGTESCVELNTLMTGLYPEVTNPYTVATFTKADFANKGDSKTYTMPKLYGGLAVLAFEYTDVDECGDWSVTFTYEGATYGAADSRYINVTPTWNTKIMLQLPVAPGMSVKVTRTGNSSIKGELILYRANPYKYIK